MTMTWIKKVWNRVRGRHQRGIQPNGRSKYPRHKLSKESFQSPQPVTNNKEDDSSLYHCSAPPPVVIEPIVGVEDDSMMNNEFKGQPIQHSTPLRKPGGELHMIIERERNSVENDHQSSKDVDHGHHSNKPKE